MNKIENSCISFSTEDNLKEIIKIENIVKKGVLKKINSELINEFPWTAVDIHENLEVSFISNSGHVLRLPFNDLENRKAALKKLLEIEK